MSSQPNRLRPTTTALAMLRRGWTLESPYNKFRLIPSPNKKWISVLRVIDNKLITDYPLTPAGFERMMNEVVNPPF